MVQHIAEGAKAAGRDPSAVDVGIYIRMCITEDEAKAVDSFRRELASYAFVDSYNKMFARYGLAAEFDEVRRLWKEGKRDEAPRAISEASCRKIAVFGKAQARPRFRRKVPRRRRHASGSLSNRPGRNIGAGLSQHDARIGRSLALRRKES